MNAIDYPVIDHPREVQGTGKERVSGNIRDDILKIFREEGSLNSLTWNMDLFRLKQLHQTLFEEAVKSGKERFGDDFNISVLRKRIDNTHEHMLKNMCSNPMEFCNGKNCDNYDPACVTRKIKDQMNRMVSEILNPNSSQHPNRLSEQDFQELEEFLNFLE